MQARGSIVLDCPIEEAFRFVSEPSNDPKWRSHLASSHGRVAAVGDRVTHTYSYGGKSKSIVLEVSEYEPPERLAYVMHEEVRVRMAFQFRAEGEGARVGVTMSSALTGAVALFEGRIQTEADRLIRTDLERLKTVCGKTG